MIASAAIFAPAGQTNFTTTKCLGANTIGRGASFANAAHAQWKSHFEQTYCADVGTFPTITYEPQGSGAGRRAVGERSGSNADGSQSRNQPPRFGMSDEPPSPTGQSQMNQGTDATGDEGIIHVIPSAVGSVAMTVNFPNNCDRALLPDSAETDPASANAAPFVDRVRFTRTQWEAVWNGGTDADNWTDVFPTLAADADCNKAITRVVRFDDSGTSFAFKDFLDRVNPGRGWLTTFTTPDTRTWPNASVGPRADCGGAQGPQGANLTSACSNGNGPLVQKLLTVDGGVGYSDVATARTNGYAITPAASAGSRDDDVFWIPGPNQGGVFEEPTAAEDGFRSDGGKGANCAAAQFTNVPSSGIGGLPATTGDWSQVSGVDSTGAYVVCTLTYGLAFDDYKNAYALQPDQTAEESKARSVKDYWTSIISDTGQATLFPNDYSPVPQAILSIARDGVNSICWDKAGTGNCPPIPTGYPRPQGALQLRVPLAIAYNQCPPGSANRTHAGGIAEPSCNPAAQSSGFLTAGTTDANGQAPKFNGSVRLTAIPGNSGTPADEADVRLEVAMTDVRNKAGLGDYSGQVQGNMTLRITDKSNGGATFTQSATVQDIPLSWTVPCTTTPADATVGSSCASTTTADAVVGSSSAVTEVKRTIWDVGDIKVFDGGADGLAATNPNTLFARQGIFIP